MLLQILFCWVSFLCYFLHSLTQQIGSIFHQHCMIKRDGKKSLTDRRCSECKCTDQRLIPIPWKYTICVFQLSKLKCTGMITTVHQLARQAAANCRGHYEYLRRRWWHKSWSTILKFSAVCACCCCCCYRDYFLDRPPPRSQRWHKYLDTFHVQNCANKNKIGDTFIESLLSLIPSKVKHIDKLRKI